MLGLEYRFLCFMFRVCGFIVYGMVFCYLGFRV